MSARHKCGIYGIRHLDSGRIYIGSAKNIGRRFDRHRYQLRSGIHHSVFLQRAWNKYGEDAFQFCIVEECDSSVLIPTEQRYLDEGHANNTLYNVSRTASGGDMISAHPDKAAIYKRRGQAQSEAILKMTEDARKESFGRPGEKNGMFGKAHTPEARQRIGRHLIGNKIFLGVKLSAERRAAISEMAKQRTGKSNPFYGKQHSLETKQKLSSKMAGRLPVNLRPVMINGAMYASVSEAARELKVCNATIIFRIKSHTKRFTGYFYVDV